MAVSIAQYVDLLFKKLQGVAKTANSTVKSASNESIASPAFIRGDVVWMQADQIPATAQTVGNITLAYTGGNSIQCTPDTTVPPIGGIRPTWLTNETYWVPQEFGSTWLPKVFVGPASAANIEATGTQIFSAGIGGVGEYYFDTQAGVLNFIGETIPTVLTAGNVVYISGYQYTGALGVTSIPSGANIGNLQISNTTITTTLANGNITLTSTGTGIALVSGSAGFGIPVGNTLQRPGTPITGTIRYNSSSNVLEIYDGSGWVSAAGTSSAVTNQTINPDGVSDTYTLDQSTSAVSILVTINGITQTPGIDYTVATDQITFTTVPLSSDIIQVRFIATTTTVTEITNSSGNTSIQTTDANTINFEIDAVLVAQITSAGVVNLANSHSLQLPAYTTANATVLTNVATGQVIYVSDGDAGQPCLAVYSGGSFKRIALGSTIST